MKLSIFHKKIPELFQNKVISRGELNEKLGQRFAFTKDESKDAIKELKLSGVLESKGKDILYFRNPKNKTLL